MCSANRFDECTSSLGPKLNLPGTRSHIIGQVQWVATVALECSPSRCSTGCAIRGISGHCWLILWSGSHEYVRTLLIALWLVVAGYKAIVTANHGFGLLPVFFGDIAAMTWPGQFNLDFMYMLTLSGIWVSWRHHFSASGLGLGLLALFGGSLFLSAYLLIVSLQAKGNINELLLGKVWAA